MKNRKLNLGALLVNGTLTTVCVAWLLYAIVNNNFDIYQKIEAVTDIIASLIATYYLIEGYSKDVSSHYKTCIGVAAINALVVIAIIFAKQTAEIVSIFACVLAFAMLVGLLIIKNLGRAMSYAMCIIIIIIRLLGLVFTYINADTTFNSEVALLFAQLCLAITIGIITYAKYVDKTSRNTE